MLCPLNVQRTSALQGGCAQQKQIISTASFNNASLKRSFVPSSRKSTSITTRRSSSRVFVQANATQKDVLEVVNPNVGTPDWYALVASADFFFNDVQNEALAEQLRERVRFYGEQGRENDIFFACEPAWLKEKYPEEAKKVKGTAVALLSTDKQWMVFMKLRLDRVIRIDLGPMDINTATKSTQDIPTFKPLDTGDWRAPYSPYSPGWWNKFVRK